MATALVTFAALDTGAFAQEQTKQPATRVLDDPRVEHGNVMFKHNGTNTIDGYLARPKAEGQYPAVLVIAGNRITEEYIPNTCAALALAGFVGLAPNVFHVLPDSAQTIPEMQKASANHTDGDVVQDVFAGIDYLRTQPFVKKGGIGVVGFCYGGRIAMLLGSRSGEIDAVVPFHPGPVTAEEIARLKCPVQIHCGTADRNVSVAAIRDLEKILKAQSTPTEVFLYEGADHGFLAYTRPPRYNPAAGKLAWERTVKFLDKHLKNK
jgi:carboxymethylenebutenolidase